MKVITKFFIIHHDKTRYNIAVPPKVLRCTMKYDICTKC